MYIIILFEAIYIVIFGIGLVADGVLRNLALWLLENLGTVKMLCYLFFSVLLVIEVAMLSEVEKNKGIVVFYTIFNALRSWVAAAYLNFIFQDFANYYCEVNIIERLLMLLGLQISFIPLFCYSAFDVFVEHETSYSSIFFGAIVSVAGILLGGLLLCM